MGEQTASATATPRRVLEPYVPLVVLEWLRSDPETAWRELDGTLAFVDISGFTALSERLAQQGRVGAEEVVDVMNATFTPLLAVGYEYGGGLLKFGGDALLLFFSEAGHSARAARAAWGMRAALRALGPLRTSVGRIPLKMHVGLHSGTCHFFLVGETHRELIVSGPAATATVAAEAAARAGEIVADGRLLERMPRARALPNVGPVPSVPAAELARYVPVALRPYLGAEAVDPEHRLATVAFLRFSRVDELVAAEGPAAAASAIHDLVGSVQRAAAEHGVCFLESDIDADGGRIVLVAGVPETAGGDEERMLRTLRAIVEARPPLTVHIGVNRGPVFAGEIGPPFRRTYTILGDTAALAARLMARAEPWQILAAGEVVERSRTIFELEALQPLRLKGRADPVAPFSVGPVVGMRVLEAQRLPLVGRQRELAILTATIGTTRLGYGTLVELIGEPGIGKSRVVEELRDRIEDMAVLSATCDQYESSTPYSAFRRLLRDVVGVPLEGTPEENSAALRTRLAAVAPELEPWIPLLALALDVEVTPTPETDELEPAFRRARLHGVLSALLARLLASPTLLLFEDVHWMDEASAELLRHLGAEVPQRPWLVCATRRPTGGGFSAETASPPLSALTLRLDPLTAEDARALAAAAGGDGVPEDELAAITERAAGNPLFVQELVSAARASSRREHAELPENVESLVAARIDRLPPGDRTLLRWASVLGLSFTSRIVEAALADEPGTLDPESWDRLSEFVERDPQVPNGLRFRHALIRDTAYEGLPFRRRRELHLRVGSTYERAAGDDPGEVAELLSLHFHRARADAQAWRYSLLAGDRARAKWANVEASAFYGRALDAARRLPGLETAEIVRVLEARGDVCELAGLYADAGEAYAAARKLLARSGDEAEPRLLRKEGEIRERTGRFSESLRWYRRGLAVVETLPAKQRPHQRAELGLAYAGVRYRQGAFTECIEWCERAADDARSSGNLPALAHAYSLLHLAYTSLGVPERERYRGLALPVYEELGDVLGQANVLNNLGIEAYYDGRWAEALDLYERSRSARERIGDVIGAATIASNIAEIKSDQGLLDDATTILEAVLETCSHAGSALMAAVARGNLGRAAARAGAHQEAAALLEEALAAFTEIKASSFVVQTRAHLAEAAALAGDHGAALARADEALAGATPAIRALLHRVRGGALLAANRPDEALAALKESLAVAQAAGIAYEVALTLEALAEAGIDESAGPQARAIFAELGVTRR